MAFLIGVDFYDCRKVAELIGTKTFLTEFIAYKDLSDLINNRKQLAGHVANNGTWYWSGDDVILISPGLADVKLKNGVITVGPTEVSVMCLLLVYLSSIFGLISCACSARVVRRRCCCRIFCPSVCSSVIDHFKTFHGMKWNRT